MLHFIKSTALMAFLWIIAMALIILVATPYAAEASSYRLGFIDDNGEHVVTNPEPMTTPMTCMEVMEDYTAFSLERGQTILPFRFVDVGEFGQLIFAAEARYTDSPFAEPRIIIFECIEDMGA